jgi:hypothetical protein
MTSHCGEDVRLPAFMVTYPSARCAACGHLIGPSREGFEGLFPVYAPRGVVHVHALVCAECLDSADATGTDVVHKLAVAVFRNVVEWLGESPSLGAHNFRNARNWVR